MAKLVYDTPIGVWCKGDFPDGDGRRSCVALLSIHNRCTYFHEDLDFDGHVNCPLKCKACLEADKDNTKN